MDKELKKVLLCLMESHSILAQAEYERNPGYNNEHFSHKAEEKILKYLEKNYPEILNEFFLTQQSKKG